eukprot:GHVN01078565.1.p4 GENE.GHVN01078565.1~~GHVN01078565.1.p4  ORF type:complete len:129 (+),score=26.78 GHVN01078565.1:673-1059(+)
MAAKGAPMLASAKGVATAAKHVGGAVRDAVTVANARDVATAKDVVIVAKRVEEVAVTAKDAVTVGRRVEVVVIARVVEIVVRPVAGVATVIWAVRLEGAAHLEVAAQMADPVIAREPAVQRDAVPKVA